MTTDNPDAWDARSNRAQDAADWTGKVVATLKAELAKMDLYKLGKKDGLIEASIIAHKMVGTSIAIKLCKEFDAAADLIGETSHDR